MTCQASTIAVSATNYNRHGRRRRRRNNTGFYYGIRDDDFMLFSTPDSDGRRRKRKDRLDRLVSKAYNVILEGSGYKQFNNNCATSSLDSIQHGRQHAISEKYDENDQIIASQTLEREDGHQYIDDDDDNVKTHSRYYQPIPIQVNNNDHYCSSIPTNNMHHQQQHSSSSYPYSDIAAALHDRLSNCLSSSQLLKQKLSSLQSSPHHFLDMLFDNFFNWNNPSRMIRIRHGINNNNPLQQTMMDQSNNNDIIGRGGGSMVSYASTMTKQKQPKLKQQQQQQQQDSSSSSSSRVGNTNKKKKRRKNNTGFYYGIREDVLVYYDTPCDDREESDGFRIEDEKKLEQKKEQSGRSMMKKSRPQGVQQNQKLLNDDDDYKSTTVPPFSTNKQTNKSSSSSKEEVNNGNNTKKKTKEKKKKNNKLSPPPQFSKKDEEDNKIVEPSPGMSNVLSETLFELREMKEEIIALRSELKAMKDKFKRDAQKEEEEGKNKKGTSWFHTPKLKEEEDEFEDAVVVDEEEEEEEEEEMEEEAYIPDKRTRLEQIGKDVEVWATSLLFDQDSDSDCNNDAGRTVNNAKTKSDVDGWKEISCNNFVKKKFNKGGRTRVYLKWMPDSRDEKDIESALLSTSSSSSQDYPCLKCYSTIDAPLDRVCSFLSNPDTIPLYNELIVDHSDVEEITPSSKITWCKMPKVLFVKPRDFVTYCSHRWRKDGTQVIVNQACEHEDMPGVMEEGQGEVCRGFALRGANFISKDPDDPNKTRITMLSHANPGGGLPQWAMNTAVNAVVQIEPFKFFHNINDSICNYQETSSSKPSQTVDVASPPGRSNKPAGIAHLGFTCFWPNGGGLKEDSSFASQQGMWSDDDEEDDVSDDEYSD